MSSAKQLLVLLVVATFRLPDQGGSRKVIALASNVKRVLKSLKSFHPSMHARTGQAEGAQRQGAEGGRCDAAARQVLGFQNSEAQRRRVGNGYAMP